MGRRRRLIPNASVRDFRHVGGRKKGPKVISRGRRGSVKSGPYYSCHKWFEDSLVLDRLLMAAAVSCSSNLFK